MALADGRIELILNTASDKPRRSTWCIPVFWDERTYLLGAGDFDDFLEAFEAGWKPNPLSELGNSEHDWRFLVKGDKAPAGSPILPEWP